MRKIVLMSLVATTGMTLFSYLLSLKKNEKFLEPLLLNQILYPKDKAGQAHHITGYILHWFVGLLFSICYKLLWSRSIIKPTMINSTWMGFVNGILGAGGWHSTFKAHSNPPKIKLSKYYLQLIVAHIIFGFLNMLAYKRLNYVNS